MVLAFDAEWRQVAGDFGDGLSQNVGGLALEVVPQAIKRQVVRVPGDQALPKTYEGTVSVVSLSAEASSLVRGR